MTAPVLTDIIPGWDLSDTTLPERLDTELLARAYRFSEKAHAGQTRRNGDPYVTHCVEVAKVLADLQLDSVTVASGLIHDVVEDTAFSVEDVEREFGREIAQIVDGLTKIGHLPLASREERQVESYRKLLLSVAKDARVILVKLADRLHNMRNNGEILPHVYFLHPASYQGKFLKCLFYYLNFYTKAFCKRRCRQSIKNIKFSREH